MTLTKAGYELNFDDALDVLVLGDEAAKTDKADKADKEHGGLLLVDFIVECEDRYIFVEVVEDEGEMKSDALCDELARKYRDSMFFHIFCGGSPKGVEYSVLFARGGVDEILLTAMQDELVRRIPVSHPSWRDDSAAACLVMNVSRWKKRYGADSIKESAKNSIK